MNLSKVPTKELLNELNKRNIFDELNQDKREWFESLKEDFIVTDIKKYDYMIWNNDKKFPEFIGSTKYVNETPINKLEEQIGLRKRTI